MSRTTLIQIPATLLAAMAILCTFMATIYFVTGRFVFALCLGLAAVLVFFAVLIVVFAGFGRDPDYHIT